MFLKSLGRNRCCSAPKPCSKSIFNALFGSGPILKVSVSALNEVPMAMYKSEDYSTHLRGGIFGASVVLTLEGFLNFCLLSPDGQSFYD